jgi:hypothetical protein
MRQSRRSKGRDANAYVITITPSSKTHIGEELTTKQRENFRSLRFYDFPELLRPVDLPHVSRQWDHPIETTSSMKRQRLNRLSQAEHTKLNGQLEEAVEACLTRPTHNIFSAPILFLRSKVDGSVRLCIYYRGRA